MALTKRDIKDLQSILDTLTRGVRYLEKPTIAVAIKGGPATTTLHCVRPLDGEVLYEVEKGIGSDLCAVWTAQGALTRFIKERAA